MRRVSRGAAYLPAGLHTEGMQAGRQQRYTTIEVIFVSIKDK